MGEKISCSVLLGFEISCVSLKTSEVIHLRRSTCKTDGGICGAAIIGRCDVCHERRPSFNIMSGERDRKTSTIQFNIWREGQEDVHHSI